MGGMHLARLGDCPPATVVKVLDDILRRMQADQAKKRATLRELRLAHKLMAEPDAART